MCEGGNVLRGLTGHRIGPEIIMIQGLRSGDPLVGIQGQHLGDEIQGKLIHPASTEYLAQAVAEYRHVMQHLVSLQFADAWPRLFRRRATHLANELQLVPLVLPREGRLSS